MTPKTPWEERYLPIVGSTMEWARQLAAEEELRHEPVDALRVRTGQQLTGRGRRGAPWWDTPGGSILTTLAVRRGGVWDPGDRNPASMALRAGLAVSRTLEAFEIAGVGIKWPNDIFIGQRKVCGILVEADPRWFYIGIGLNVGLPSIPPGPPGEQEVPPGGLDGTLLRGTGLYSLVHVLDRTLAQAVRAGDWLPEVRRRLVWLGRFVRLERESASDTIGALAGIDEDGAILISDDSSGESTRYMAGTLRLAKPS